MYNQLFLSYSRYLNFPFGKPYTVKIIFSFVPRNIKLFCMQKQRKVQVNIHVSRRYNLFFYKILVQLPVTTIMCLCTVCTFQVLSHIGMCIKLHTCSTCMYNTHQNRTSAKNLISLIMNISNHSFRAKN